MIVYKLLEMIGENQISVYNNKAEVKLSAMRHIILSTPFCDMCRAERELLNLFESVRLVRSIDEL